MTTLMNRETKMAIVDNMEDVLAKYDWSYRREALEKIYDTWFSRKRELINILSKHPKWNPEKMYIHFDTDYTRTVDKSAIIDFKGYIYYSVGVLGSEKIYDNYCTEFPTSLSYIPKWYPITEIVTYFFDTLFRSIEGSKVTDALEKELNELYPELKAKTGQKLSRLIHKFCTKIGLDKDVDYNRKFAKLADNLCTLTYTRHTVLSLNPVDYLMMSHGNTWASCHVIDVNDYEERSQNHGGCYCAGTLSYMLDEVSMVFYTVDKTADENNLELEHKILRNMFHYQNNKLLQARLYPQCNDDNSSNELRANIRAIVQKIFADCLGINNLWKVTTKYGNYCESDSNSRHYEDYFEFTCHMSYPKEFDSLENTGAPILIGASPICIECGKDYCIDDTNTINGCSGRPNEKTCECCGCRIYYDDYYEFEGDYYCEDCVVWSEIMEMNIPRRLAIYIKDDYATESYLEEHHDTFGYCENCGCWFLKEDTEGSGYCDICENDFEVCEECGCTVTPDEECYHNNSIYCYECYKRLFNEK